MKILPVLKERTVSLETAQFKTPISPASGLPLVFKTQTSAFQSYQTPSCAVYLGTLLVLLIKNERIMDSPSRGGVGGLWKVNPHDPSLAWAPPKSQKRSYVFVRFTEVRYLSHVWVRLPFLPA